MSSNPNLDGIEERLAAIEAKREAKAAELKARWDHYYEQLAKMPTFQGGAKRGSAKVRIDQWD